MVADSTLTPKKILILDDEKPLANALQAKLRLAGFEVKALYTGETVEEELATQSYDLILLDLLMPVVDGWTVLEKLKGRGQKIIVTSNLSQDEDIKRAKELGALDFLVKSEVSLADITDKVTALVNTQSQVETV